MIELFMRYIVLIGAELASSSISMDGIPVRTAASRNNFNRDGVNVTERAALEARVNSLLREKLQAFGAIMKSSDHENDIPVLDPLRLRAKNITPAFGPDVFDVQLANIKVSLYPIIGGRNFNQSAAPHQILLRFGNSFWRGRKSAPDRRVRRDPIRESRKFKSSFRV